MFRRLKAFACSFIFFHFWSYSLPTPSSPHLPSFSSSFSVLFSNSNVHITLKIVHALIEETARNTRRSFYTLVQLFRVGYIQIYIHIQLYIYVCRGFCVHQQTKLSNYFQIDFVCLVTSFFFHPLTQPYYLITFHILKAQSSKPHFLLYFKY